MNKKVYEDGKYSIQDVGTLYLGPKYTLGEILEEEEIPFKLRLLIEQHVLPKADAEDTLETHLYYLEPGSFLVRLYGQLKAKVRITVLEEKRSAKGAAREYVTRMLTVGELAAMPPGEKEKRSVAIQEFSVSKLALMMF